MIPNPLLPFDAPERAGDVLQLPVPTATPSSVNYPAGNLIAVDATGTAQLADDAAGLRVVGRAEYRRGQPVWISTRGRPSCASSAARSWYAKTAATNPVTQAIGRAQPCYVQDCQHRLHRPPVRQHSGQGRRRGRGRTRNGRLDRHTPGDHRLVRSFLFLLSFFAPRTLMEINADQFAGPLPGLPRRVHAATAGRATRQRGDHACACPAQR